MCFIAEDRKVVKKDFTSCYDGQILDLVIITLICKRKKPISMIDFKYSLHSKACPMYADLLIK